MRNEQSPTIQHRHSTWGGNLRLDVSSLGKASFVQTRQWKKLMLGKAPFSPCRCQQKNRAALAAKHNWCLSFLHKYQYQDKLLSKWADSDDATDDVLYDQIIFLNQECKFSRVLHLGFFPHLDLLHYSRYASEVSEIISVFSPCASSWEVTHFVPEYVLENWENCLGCLTGLARQNH